MPKLSELTDYEPPQQERIYVSPNMPTSEDGDYFTKPIAPVPELPADNIVERIIKKLAETEFSPGTDIGNKLAGTGGKERYQLWPEKVIRSALTAIPDAYSGKLPMTGLTREDFTDVPYEPKEEDKTWLGKALGIDPVAPNPSNPMIERAMDMATFAGVGGMGGTGAGAGGVALGAGPSLRPALKYKDRLYKGKEGQQHMDVIPPQLYPEFQKMAMSGEDISHYNFGFVNDKGHFLSREDALKYGIDTGLIDPQAGKFGALTSTLMADSSKPGTAIEAMAKTAPKLSLKSAGDNKFFINDITGKEVARLAVDYADGDLNIVNISGAEGANSIGPSAIRDLLPQLLKIYSDAKVIGGFRAGGARAANNSKNKIVEYKVRSIDHEPEF